MQEPKLRSFNGNWSLGCFGICLLLTTALIIAIINGAQAIVQVGVPIFLMSIASAVAGIVFGIRAHRVKEEKFRYQFGIAFNAIMIFMLIMIVAMFFFLRAEHVPGV